MRTGFEVSRDVQGVGYTNIQKLLFAEDELYFVLPSVSSSRTSCTEQDRSSYLDHPDIQLGVIGVAAK